MPANDQSAPIPQLLGILNVGSESFSGNRADLKTASTAARALVDDGADLIDVGVQSLRTDLAEVPVEVEAALLKAAVAAVHAAVPEVPISVDAYRASALEGLTEHGVRIINDTSGREDPQTAELIGDRGLRTVITFNPGPVKARRPRGLLIENISQRCLEFFERRIAQLDRYRVTPAQVIIDIGPDLYKNPAQTVELLSMVKRMRTELGVESALWAVSRKDFIGAILNAAPAERDAGTLGALAGLPISTSDLVRVHNVRAVHDFYRVRSAVHTGLDINVEISDAIRHDH